jgi:hypothetical protein
MSGLLPSGKSFSKSFRIERYRMMAPSFPASNANASLVTMYYEMTNK